MGKFVKGIMLGAVVGATFEMVMMPQMDRRTQRTMKRTARKMRRVAGNTYDGIHDWMN